MNGLLSGSDELYHYGMPRRSGRYPWGSGERPYQGDGIATSSSSSKKKMSRGKKVAIAAGVTAVGVATVGVVMHKVGNQKLSEFKSSLSSEYNLGQRSITRELNNTYNTWKLYSDPRNYKEAVRTATVNTVRNVGRSTKAALRETFGNQSVRESVRANRERWSSAYDNADKILKEIRRRQR